MNKSILFISHEMSRTGAPMMILQAAKALKKEHFAVTVLYYKAGPFIKDFIDEGISVVHAESQFDPSEILSIYGEAFDLIIINTIVCFGASKTFINKNIPVLWWIHEGRALLPAIKDSLPEHLSENFHLICVCRYAQDLLLQIDDTYMADVLYNCVEDCTFEIDRTNNVKRFICVGSIESRKGQDIILRAIDEIAMAGINDIEFIFVGKILEESIGEKIESYCEKYPFVKIYPVMSHKDVLSLIASSTALIAPSRDDPGPLTAIEAMMLKIPIIVSDQTGISDLIEDGVNGFVIKNENDKELAEKIIWFNNNPDKAILLGNKERETYEKYFSIEHFNENYTNLVKKILKNSNDNTSHQSELSLTDHFNTLFEEASSLEKKNNDLKETISDLERAIQSDNLTIQNMESTIQNDNLTIQNMEEHIHSLQMQNSDIINSFSYKVGRFITWLPRKIADYLLQHK